ncbi:MAG: phosphatidate cytidylyltransferase [Myxococcota bacterium]
MLIRVLSAFSALPVVLGLLWIGGWAFGALALVVGAVSLWEFNAMTQPPEDTGAKAVFTVLGVGLLALELTGTLRGGVALLAVGFLPMASVSYYLVRTGDVATAAARGGLGVLGMTWAGGLLGATCALRLLPDGFSWLVLACAFAWGSDSGAYFVGRFLGRTKLYPKISPAKTVEGALGGIVVGTAMGFGVWFVVGPSEIPATHLLVIGPIGAFMGQVGDLTESLLKRSVGVKDSGRFMPGHGGMFDRIDALLFAGPTLLAYALWVADVPIRWLSWPP